MTQIKKTTEDRIGEIIAKGIQSLSRVEVSKILGCTEKQARYALEKIRDGLVEVEPAVEAKKESLPSQPPKHELPPIQPSNVIFKRSSISELTNWSDWDREHKSPQRIEAETKSGTPKTIKVIHDPGIAWPPEWQGPKSYLDLMIEGNAPKARPMKWGMLVTGKQSHTPLHGPALMSLATYSAWGGHSIIMLGIETKAPSGGSKVDEVATWSLLTEQYVTTAKHDLGGIVLDAAYPMKHTYENPLEGMQVYCKGRPHIFGSPRQDMLTFNRIEGKQAAAWCSGVVTMPNYSHTKSGMVAIENHVIGALVVECDFDDNIFVRNLEIDPHNGDLWDIDIVIQNGVLYSNKTSTDERPIVNAGCVHAKWANKDCLRAIFAIGGKPSGDIPLIDALDPSNLILHDTFDAYSVSPHNRKNPMLKLKKAVKGDDDLAAEIKLTADLIHAMTSKRRDTWLVDSNHDRHFERHLLERDFKSDLKNAEIMLATNLAMVKAMNSGNFDFNPLHHALKQANKKLKFKAAGLNNPLRFKRYYYHCHGDKGTNGSGGSDTNLAGMGIFISAAHTHSTMRRRNLVRTGCIIDPPPHVAGATNLSHAIGVEYPNGSYQLIPIINGKYRP